MNKLDLFFLKMKSKISSTLGRSRYKTLPAISSIEMILLLLVLVSIVVIFRNQIIGIVNSVFNKVKTQINAF